MTLKPGDQIWVGPAEVVDINDPWVEIIVYGNKSEHTVLDYAAIPDVPHLAHIAQYLADHPETVDALDRLCDESSCKPDYELGRGLVNAMRGEGGHDAG